MNIQNWRTDFSEDEKNKWKDTGHMVQSSRHEELTSLETSSTT